MSKISPSQQGFQLLEILITLSIIGILMAFTLPIYSQHLVKAHRLEAATMLSKLAIALEEYQFAHASYAGVTLQALGFPELVAENNYRLVILTANENAYTLAAQPLAEQAAHDVDCATLLLNSQQEKNITGTSNVTACW